ncbi:EF-hand domain-containing protein [Tropicibacter naphthalenivorans]|uniref:EF hand n=1 Tax=Tropicibacter naphthalenivorans TaxID=441103 RepID=A0A0N7M171_9RHOB|nr:EF-hand domain-containing protein [Tropicibacter naphthalenivorans]CUH82449.1 EF hand [Tropicibacter naphthalenivorans]SMD06063.1 Ca2+-binding protein, EF-hand superfamily [Tropicibacter naphthalenivorans]
MKKTALMTTGVLVLAMGVAGAASAHGDRGGQRGAGFDMLFQQFDLDADGKVTADEVEQAKAQRFTDADTDGNGFLSPEELSAAATAMRAQADAARQEARQARMMARLDTDEDGQISAEEMAAAGPGANMFDRMVSRFDADNDGAISKEELETARAQMGERRKGGHDGKMRGHERGGWMPWRGQNGQSDN